MNLFDLLDDALDDLPRYYAIADQPLEGVVVGDEAEPRMIACVSVDDVRKMLRQKTRRVAL